MTNVRSLSRTQRFYIRKSELFVTNRNVSYHRADSDKKVRDGRAGYRIYFYTLRSYSLPRTFRGIPRMLAHRRFRQKCEKLGDDIEKDPTGTVGGNETKRQVADINEEI